MRVTYRNRSEYYHNMTNTRMYKIWSNMLTRCNNKNSPNYYRYGGRGTMVCKRWLKFYDFYIDMKDGYADNLSLDRVNNKGNYTKKNCRWVTVKEQALNRHNTIYLTAGGETKKLVDWAKEKGLSPVTIRVRLFHGRTHEEALSPAKKQYSRTKKAA